MNFKNKSSIFLLVFFLIFLLLLISHCKTQRKGFRYEIHGLVNHGGVERSSVWYTDQLEFGRNCLIFNNSKEKEIIVKVPYVIIDYQYNDH